jgi:hypothetical protein
MLMRMQGIPFLMKKAGCFMKNMVYSCRVQALLTASNS